MNRRRGFSLVDVLLATAITVILVGSMTSLYLFSSSRSAHALTTDAASNQAQEASATIDKIIAKAVAATVVTIGGATGLKVTLPQNGTDSDGDGVMDTFTPKSLTAGSIKWGTGQRVWIYMSDTNGNFLTTGTILTMAVRNDDLFPTGTNRIASFTFYMDTTKPRWNLVDGITWSANSANGTAGYTLRTSSLVRAERASATAYAVDQAVARTASLTRMVDLQNKP